MSILNLNWAEGTTAVNGLNWGWDRASQPRIALRLWRLMIYFRRRSNWIMEGNKEAHNTPKMKRIYWDVSWQHYFLMGGLEYDFMTKRLVFNNRAISFQMLIDFIEREGINAPTKPRS